VRLHSPESATISGTGRGNESFPPAKRDLRVTVKMAGRRQAWMHQDWRNRNLRVGPGRIQDLLTRGVLVALGVECQADCAGYS
jgi:hypothetical protein